MKDDHRSENESSVDQLPNIATPLAERSPDLNSTGDISMDNNNLKRGPLATPKAYAESDDARGFADSAGYNVDDARDVVEGYEWIASLIEAHAKSPDPAKTLTDEIAIVAEALEGASTDLRDFIANYYKFSGAIDAATSAIERFGDAPTSENRAKLLEAAKPLDGHRIAMPERLRRCIRPHVTRRDYRSCINFGSLHFIVRDHVRLNGSKEAA